MHVGVNALSLGILAAGLSSETQLLAFGYGRMVVVGSDIVCEGRVGQGVSRGRGGMKEGQ